MADDHKEQQHQAENTKQLEKYFNYRNIRRGVLLFMLITLITFTGLFLYTNTGESLDALKQINLKYIALAALLVVFDWWMGGLRNHIFASKTNPGLSQKVCFDANLANIFMGAVTPSQTGGGPMHLYMLNRGGIKLTDGIAISIINFIATIIWFATSAGLALWYLKDTEMNSTLQILLQSGVAIFSTLLTLILFGLIAPGLMGRILTWLSRYVGALPFFSAEKIKKVMGVITEKLQEYNQTVILLVKENPMLLLFSLLITVVMYFNKYFIAYVIILGMNIDVDFWSIISVQAILFFLLYFSPSPGGSGVAELGTAALMAPFMPTGSIASFVVIHRTFQIFIPALVGAMITLRELKKHSEE